MEEERLLDGEAAAPEPAAPPPDRSVITTSADDYAWWRFCDMMEHVIEVQQLRASAMSHKNKTVRLRSLVYPPWTKEAKTKGESLYPYIRLVIPSADSRKANRMKEKSIAQ